jgi:hypothetical protein
LSTLNLCHFFIFFGRQNNANARDVNAHTRGIGRKGHGNRAWAGGTRSSSQLNRHAPTTLIVGLTRTGYNTGVVTGPFIIRTRCPQEPVLDGSGEMRTTMHLSYVTWSGPGIDDPAILQEVPSNLSTLLQEINGFIQFHGGLHVRGACSSPAWHSLRDAWHSERAFHRLYPNRVLTGDVPFAQDFLGNQFLLRDRMVVFLHAETGVAEDLGVGLGSFFKKVEADPVSMLHLEPLLKFQEQGHTLAPGELLAVFPPICTKQAGAGLSSSAVSDSERRTFLARFAEFVSGLPEGSEIDFKLE